MNASSRMCRCKYLIRPLTSVRTGKASCSRREERGGRDDGGGGSGSFTHLSNLRERKTLANRCECVKQLDGTKEIRLEELDLWRGFNLKNLWFSLMEYA